MLGVESGGWDRLLVRHPNFASRNVRYDLRFVECKLTLALAWTLDGVNVG